MTNCLECQNLSRVYESKLTRYLAARSAVLYRISTEFAAKQQVDMERAKTLRVFAISDRSARGSRAHNRCSKSFRPELVPAAVGARPQGADIRGLPSTAGQCCPACWCRIRKRTELHPASRQFRRARHAAWASASL